MSSPLTAAKKKRGGHRGWATNLVTEATEKLSEEIGEEELNLLLTGLKERLEILKELDAQVLEILSNDESTKDEAIQVEVGESGKLRQGMQKTLIQVEGRLRKLQTAQQSATISMQQVQTTGPAVNNVATASLTSRVRLPKMDIQKFDGKVCEWAEFWDAYKSCIHENKSLTAVEKFTYLRSYLADSARACVAGFALTEANYEEAVALLKDRFGKDVVVKRAHVNGLMNMKAVYSESDVSRLRAFYDKVETHHRTLAALKADEESYSSIVVPSLLEKLPETVRLTITRGEDYEQWGLSDLIQNLKAEIELREKHQALRPQRKEWQPSDGKRKMTATSSALFARQGDECAFCLGSHPPEKCERVTTITERKNIVRKYARCFACLKKGHRSRECRSKSKCYLCKGSHHTALCEGGAQSRESPVSITHQGVGGGNGEQVSHFVVNPSNQNLHVSEGNRVFLQTAQGIVKGQSGQGRARVLFDTGSHRSFVTAKIVGNLGLPRVRSEWLGISTIGKRSECSDLTDVVKVDITPMGGGSVLSLEAFVVPEISTVRNEHVEFVKRDYAHLKNLWFSDVCKSREELEIDILIGADYLWTFQKGRTVRGNANEPVAVQTVLGWVLSGPMKTNSRCNDDRQEVQVNFVAQELEKERLDEQISKLWDLETIGIRQSDDVHDAFISSILHTDSNRYSVKLPWKAEHETLPTNYELSLSRMKGQIKRLSREPEVLAEYDSIITEQLSAGIIEKVTELEPADRVHYIPHQAVIRREAKTTKLRIVYDASAKEKGRDGKSLNDCLHVGPSMNPLLFDILLRFRENRIALVGDIEKAFLNIEVDEKDRDSLRFLWVEDVQKSNLKVVAFRFCRVPFGVSSSPFLLNATLRYHLETYQEQDPSFVRKMKDSFYVDDLATGSQSLDETYSLYQKAKSRMACGGFKLRKWLTNNPTLREKIRQTEEDSTAIKKPIHRLDETETFAKSTLEPNQGGPKGERVLGLAWDLTGDFIQFHLTHIAERAEKLEPTKRNVLSLLASLFDPLGLISPVTVSMKMLFQTLCKAKVDWDEPLSGEERKKWDKWKGYLYVAREIKISRCVYENSSEKVTECFLHGFGDASKKAYCALVYLVYKLDSGETRVSLLASKTRIAPLKELTIPRLELMSGRILAQLVSKVSSALQSQLKIDGIRLWLDSKTALCWIRNSGEWKQFVSHRVREILRLTDRQSWSHCPGEENPADLGSRGRLASELKGDRLWWEGPEWLKLPKQDWPATDEILQTAECVEEAKKTASVMHVGARNKPALHVGNVIDIERFSKLGKLLRGTAWVKRFVHNLKALTSKEPKLTANSLLVREIREAEREWVRAAQSSLRQQSNFDQLTHGLRVVEDTATGVLRCEGRLANADLGPDARKPLILPKDHHLAKLIIMECHERVQHSGLRATLAELRSRYWVPRGRQIVKKILSGCVVCRKVAGKAYKNPPTAALPEFRVTESPPFTKVGVDFAGPLYIKCTETSNKVYIALFTCAVTRALHLELVRDLTAATFRRCLRRFIARRGVPALIVSDNAKTFKATAKALEELFNHPEVKSDLSTLRIEWRFNLEKAPWWGGFFERMVGSVKGCLRKVLGSARLTFDELSTVLTEVEATLNSRPLTYDYTEIDEEVLTPSHLIYGRRLTSLPDEIIEPEEADSASQNKAAARMKHLSTRLAHYWNRWRKEYLTNLREFHRIKTAVGNRDIEIGDVVIVFEEGKKRGQWKTGIVEKLITGKDKVIRGATVRVLTKGKPTQLSRPIQHLYPLEIRCKSNPSKPVAQAKETEPIRRMPQRSAALDAKWKSKLMLDS